MSNGSEGAPAAITLANAFATSPSPMLVTDARAPDHPIVWANAAFLAHTGYGLDEVQGRNCRMLQGPGTDAAEVARLRDAVTTGRPVTSELLNYRKDGTAFWNAMTVTPVHDERGLAFFFAAQMDTTHVHQVQLAMRNSRDELERQVAERTRDLSHALEQKTALLHEIDHRVKNNLQVISSLMLLKARRTPEGEARDALEGMAERIGALSIAHRLLYSEEDSTHFALTEFVGELLSDIDTGMADDRVGIETRVDPLKLPASMAAPLALMIHELVSNALRHAFPGGRAGRVSVTAWRTETGMGVEVRDTGIGIAQCPPNEAGFGRGLVEMVTRQLRGSVRWADTAPGTRVEIAIPLRSTS
ncbi:histidine kinase dimerization/phosphoacceptor domain -containing protein [Methylobacterium sp. J-076]|uniref:histidine kinase dimerization/phosphoacceptor domain -containing protein n=1 Tax=Methylobacterium sp. J-076 TaxID=2836655 RepID=UPI001FB9DF35|nr:histidine kinase dimerization/phosphoacceptor domain -containing protein [Methylobacterium sp. J-076]MCJ2013825.1 PAS domain-containing protein [Methylobacterium sp. J-076]